MVWDCPRYRAKSAETIDAKMVHTPGHSRLLWIACA